VVSESGIKELTKCDRCCLSVFYFIWAAAIIILAFVAAVNWPHEETKETVAIIFLVLGVPLVLVAWKAVPLPKRDWDAALQHRGIKHLRSITGIQAIIGGAAMALLFTFEADDASVDLANSMLLWTGAAAFYFIAHGYQIKMEVPKEGFVVGSNSSRGRSVAGDGSEPALESEIEPIVAELKQLLSRSRELIDELEHLR